MKSSDDDDSTLNSATQWCAREKIRHFAASSLNRSSLYDPFVYITSKLTPAPSKGGFTPLSMGRKVIKDSNWFCDKSFNQCNTPVLSFWLLIYLILYPWYLLNLFL